MQSWGTVEMSDPQGFLTRPEFLASAFGTVFFQLPSHRNVGINFFAGDDIVVRLQRPSIVGRRHALGGRANEGTGQFVYNFETRSASSDQAFAQYSKALMAQVEVGPLPERLPF